MKRSEMVEMIHSEITDCHHAQYGEFKLSAEKLLSMIEDYMVPLPQNEVIHSSNAYHFMYKWEDEND